MLLSVVIAALNSENTIGRTLSSVFSNSLPSKEFEVIVVDNGSTDNTVEAAKRYPVKIFSCAKRGQGAARNLGIAKARGEIICFTDSDIVVPENWLRKILEFFSIYQHADGVGGPVLAPPSGHLNNLQKLEGETYARTHDFPTEMVESKFGDHIGSLYSANCAYRRDVLISSNGFDESGFDAVDIDLCWRLILKGKRLVFNPGIKVIHLGFPWSLKAVFRQQFRWGESRGKLNMRYPSTRTFYTGLKSRILRYYFFVVLFAQILYSKDRTKSILQLFEKCAFTCGCIKAYLEAYFGHKTHANWNGSW
jgi:glycosyltransferase involved in cell wall biosynthesis